MSYIIVLPNIKLCKNGLLIYSKSGNSLCDNLINNDILIEHACEQFCACATCHVIIKKGMNFLNSPSNKENNLLSRAWGVELRSRLSCQVIIPKNSIFVIEIPRYSLNHF